MDPFLEELVVAARRLLELRAIVCVMLVASYGLAFGWVLKAGADAVELGELVGVGAVLIAAATFVMKFADFRAESARRRRLDALYGRRS